MNIGFYKRYIKRVLDFIFSIIALVILSPILAIIALLIKIKLGSPVIFKQARPGENEKIFYLYKFRSMTNETDADGRLLPDAQRITKLGNLLRTTSLDELPELINILKGDMSFVGPRPLSIFYLSHFSTEQQKRQEVRPGLTGLAQVNGRNNLEWDDRFALDIQYVDHITFSGDVKIICDTVLKVLRGADISVRGTTKVLDFGPYSVVKEQGKGGKKEGNETFSEIGGYFWLDGTETINYGDKVSWLPSVEDFAFTLSGRAAIDIALRDVLVTRDIKKVYVPSYCCVSMLQPFIDCEIKYEFYNVKYKNGGFLYQIPKVGNDSLVLIMNYFGIGIDQTIQTIEKIHKDGAIVIEDITHSFFNDACGLDYSDYLVASFRGSLSVASGGWVGKRLGKLFEKPTIEGNGAVNEKISAMKDEYAYLTGGLNSKDDFLLKQAKFENDLIHVDKMLKIDDLSLGILTATDIKEVTEKRRENVAILYYGLQDLEGKICRIPKINLDNEVPVFLPIFLKEKDRDSLKQYLTSKGIYCPIHWRETMGARAGVRPHELSLICDQRYGIGDMQVIVDEIHKWYIMYIN